MRISFYPATEYVSKFVEKPVPASSCIPDWYKQIPPIKESSITLTSEGISGLNLKACMPFIDALTAGYIQKTWTDIYINRKENEIEYTWPIGPEIMKNRNHVSPNISPMFYSIEFIWQSVWRARLPKGYSLLITHPLNRLDLPFTTMTGCVDADTFYHTPIGNIPFFIHSSFEGKIPSGTPMFQMIPIKRDTWESFIEPFNEDETERRDRQIRQYISGAYKTLFRQKKTYR